MAKQDWLCMTEVMSSLSIFKFYNGRKRTTKTLFSMKRNKKNMEQESHSAFWIMAGVAVVAGIVWAMYKNNVAKEKERYEKEKDRKMNQLRLLAASCWDMFVAFKKQDSTFDTCRNIISADGILFDYQLLMGIINEDMDDEQKKIIIQDVIGNNLTNLLESKLTCENGVWKVRALEDLSITRESYLYNLGFRDNQDGHINEVIVKMTGELQHQREKIALQQKDENYKFYGVLFDELIPYVGDFSNSIHAKGLNTQDVLKIGRNFADNMHNVLQKNGITTVFYRECPVEKKDHWFVPSTNGRELPAILRTSTQSLYRKGTNINI